MDVENANNPEMKDSGKSFRREMRELSRDMKIFLRTDGRKFAEKLKTDMREALSKER